MISKTAVHAIKAVLALAEQPGELQGAAHIADGIGAPQNYLGKLLQTLAQEGILYSQKGMGGGFQLAKAPEDISLFDIVEPIDHVSRWSGCFMGQGECSAEAPCAMHERWGKVRDAYFAMLHDSTVADLLTRKTAVPPAM